MPNPNMGESKNEFMKRCVPMVMEDGTASDNDQAVAVCMAKWEKGAAKSFNLSDRRYGIEEAFNELYPPPKPMPMPTMNDERPWISEYFDDFVIVCDKGTNYKVSYTLNGEKVEFAPRSEWKEAISMRIWTAIKAVGDWEIDINSAPFNRPDSDNQTFDDGTDFMLEDFPQPAIFYHHGIMPGKKGLQKKPIVIGKTVGVEKRVDGLHLRVVLNKSLEWAKRVWEAAKKGLAVASSDSIAHLARLEVSGKLIMYEKDKAGRIAVWPLAGVSLWDKTEGNFQPASRYALALPAVKAMYREAGIPFPALDSHGAVPEAEQAARRAEVIKKSNEILKKRRISP